MRAGGTSRFPTEEDEWTPARVFMLVAAVWHLLLGGVGLAINRSFPLGGTAASTASSDRIFGIFETNGWHSLAALLLGVLAAYFLLFPRRAREVALGIGVGHVAIVAALVLWPPETFWLASNAADQVVHASTAILGLISGFATRPVVGATAS